MNLEDCEWLYEAVEIPSQRTGSPFKELLEKMFEVMIRLERKAVLGINDNHLVSPSGSYTNSFNSDVLSKTSGTLNRLASDVPSPVDTPLYPSKIKRGQRNSEALLNVAAECYIEGVSAGEGSRIFKLFEVGPITSTQVSDTSKKAGRSL